MSKTTGQGQKECTKIVDVDVDVMMLHGVGSMVGNSINIFPHDQEMGGDPINFIQKTTFPALFIINLLASRKYGGPLSNIRISYFLHVTKFSVS